MRAYNKHTPKDEHTYPMLMVTGDIMELYYLRGRYYNPHGVDVTPFVQGFYIFENRHFCI